MAEHTTLLEEKPEEFSAVSISLASPEDIRSWSYGEVKKPETINYRTYRAEKDGLFCERIFGPERDWECFCGKYKGMKHKGIICDRCGVKVTHSRERRKRMGHINLAAPIVHIWFFKAMPSRLGTLLAMKTSDLEKVVYFQEYVVVEPGPAAAAGVREKDLLTEERYRKLKEEHGEAFRADMGAEAIRELVRKLDLPTVAAELRAELIETGSKQRKTDIVKRLKLVEALKDSPNKADWMIMDVIPVIPPDLRPLVLLESGNFATSDLNDLYRRVINRNNRLKKLQDLHAPEVIIRNEKRMLQQAVDALFDNDRTKRPVLGSSNRPLKSLTDMIKGKQGRFRENLLGKRVDYSARSVIVVGPELKLNQCGLPKKIALELFQPFIIRRLKELGYVDTIKSAKKMLERKDEEVWDILDEVIREHPVLLNRAPTLHRMGIQAFEPTLVEGNAIRIHPLVCEAFNADFDGDQMAVHLPLSVEAQAEASILMMSTNNIFSPADGEPIIKPTLDMVLGCYYGTVLDDKLAEGAPRVFSDTTEALLAFEEGRILLHQPVEVRFPEGTRVVDDSGLHDMPANRRITTTAGRVKLNEILPPGLPFYNVTLDKGRISGLITDCHRTLGRGETIRLLDSIKDFGFKQATLGGLSIASEDLRMPADKYEIIERARKEVDERIEKNYRKGLITDSERHHQVTETWTHASNAVADEVMVELKRPRLRFAGLEEYLHEVRLGGATTLELTLHDIEKKTGEPVPPSVERYKEYWLETGHNPLGVAISRGGWQVSKLVQSGGKITGARLILLSNARYAAIEDLLRKRKPADGLTEVSVKELEAAIDGPLPRSAYEEDQYWRNITHNPLGIAIHRAGWQVRSLRKSEDKISGAVLELINLPVSAKPTYPEQGTAEAGRERDAARRYNALEQYLRGQNVAGASNIVLSVQEIKEQLGQPLPPSAEKYPQYWFDRTQNPLGVAIHRAGWRVAKIERNAAGKITGAHLEASARINPIRCMYDSGAKGTAMQIRQMAGMRGLMSKPSGEIIETPIKANFREGLPVLEYFSSTHGGRKGLADTALKTAESGYLTRKLADVAQHVVIAVPDCHTTNGITKTVIYSGDRVEVSLADAISGRVAAETVKDRRSGAVVAAEGDTITHEIAEAIEKLGYDSLKVRSAMTCEAPFGICAKCYGMDLSTRQLAEEGLAVGIIAAQSIGEPGTQLTMRTFHIGGIATTKGAAEADYRAAAPGSIAYENLSVVEGPEGEPVVLNQNGELILRDTDGREIRRYPLRIGARVQVKDGAKVTGGKVLASWDPHMVPIIAEKNGVARFIDILEGETFHVEIDTGGTERHVITEHKGDLHPQIMIEDAKGEILAAYSIPEKAYIEVNENQHVKAGTLLARTPRQIGRTQDITAGLPRVTELFEARKPKDPAIISEISGIVHLGERKRGRRSIIVRNEQADMEREHLVPQGKRLLVTTGSFVREGDALVDGPLVPHDILRIKGEEALQQYLLSEVQSVYRFCGEKINDKHIEVIVAQMLRKVHVGEDVGATNLLPGAIVDKFQFRAENERVVGMSGRRQATTFVESPIAGEVIRVGSESLHIRPPQIGSTLAEYSDTFEPWSEMRGVFQEEPDKAKKTLKLVKTDDGFLMAVILMRVGEAQKAFEAVYFIDAELGSLGCAELAEKYNEDELEKTLRESKEINSRLGQPSRRELAETILRAGAIIKEKYKGETGNIWLKDAFGQKKEVVEAIYERLCEILYKDGNKGSHQKRAWMAICMRRRNFGVKYPDPANISIPVDQEVRTAVGHLLMKGSTPKKRSEALSREEIKTIQKKVKDIYPECPGHLDIALWHIGRNYDEKTSKCNWDKCPKCSTESLPGAVSQKEFEVTVPRPPRNAEVVKVKVLVHVGDEVEAGQRVLTADLLEPFSGKPASASSLLLGITKAALRSESFISAASFQETTKVLTEAALAGKRDNLLGLKENVILGHMIPAGTGFYKYRPGLMKKLELPEEAASKRK